MAVDSYANLTTAIGTWARRTFTSGQTDEFIALAEAHFARRLGSNYRRKVTQTVNTDASGVGTIPTAAVRIESITRDVLGSLPLKQVSWNAFVKRNPYEIGADGEVYALKGLSFYVTPVTDDNFIVVTWDKLTGLSSGNTTNWLLTLAPDIYLAMCRSVQCAFNEDEARAALFKSQVDEFLDDLIAQANVAEYGNVEMTLPQVEPAVNW